MTTTKTVIACVGSSLLTVGLLSLAGFGPLDPPTGAVAPTGVTLSELAAAMADVSPGSNLPTPLLTGGGTATMVFADHTEVVPLLGYSFNRPGSGSSGVLAIALQAGPRGAKLSAGGTLSFTITIVGSDGTTFGPTACYRNSRTMVNGPVAGGNKAIHIIYLGVNGTPNITDQSGTGPF